MGPSVEEIWSDSDYEFWTRIPAEAVAQLAFHLLADRFQGQAGATDVLHDFCKSKGIPCEWESWA